MNVSTHGSLHKLLDICAIYVISTSSRSKTVLCFYFLQNMTFFGSVLIIGYVARSTLWACGQLHSAISGDNIIDNSSYRLNFNLGKRKEIYHRAQPERAS